MKRAYPQLDITASTLVESTADLIKTYSNAAENSREFQETWGGSLFLNTDATKIENTLSMDGPKFDIILFNHPHLGDATLLSSEKHHAQRHHVLLSHYFHSAKQFLNERGRIHVCLCGNQPTTWNLAKSVQLNGLVYAARETTDSPVDKWLFRKGDDTTVAAAVESHYPCPRKYRNGRLGGKHWLGKYGYRHRRTSGDLYGGNDTDMTVHQSVNFVFEIDASYSEMIQQKQISVMKESQAECNICGVSFKCKKALHEHLKSPALPDIMTGDFLHGKENAQEPVASQDQNDHQSKRSKVEEHQKSNPLASQPVAYISIENTRTLVEASVESRFDSKRIKWLCRQEDFSLSKHIKSKKQCTDAIKIGRIYVNGAVATDSSRIVREHDIITLIDASGLLQEDNNSETIKDYEEQRKEENLGVKVLKEIPIERYCPSYRLVVAYKPVGIRVVGSFSPNTLEMITKKLSENPRDSKEVQVACVAVSKLDTGCAGLCVLILAKSMTEATIPTTLQVTYKFTVLVHGTVPDEWRDGVYVMLPKNGVRKWKRQKADKDHSKSLESIDANSKENDTEGIEIAKSELNLEHSILISCIDSLTSSAGNEKETKLSTLSVHSKHDSGRLCSVISFVFRRLGYPVVNDRFCKRELAALPRRMRNILKQKICIGCYSLKIQVDSNTSTIVDYPCHRRTQCTYWRDILDISKNDNE